MELTPDLSRVRVLIVEDDLDNRRLISEILRNRGACVSSVSSAEEALGEAEDFVPDVVVTDLRLPGKSGYELAKELCAKHPTIRTMAFSGAVDTEIERQAQAPVFVDFVYKPCSPAELIRHVASAARRWPLRRKLH